MNDFFEMNSEDSDAAGCESLLQSFAAEEEMLQYAAELPTIRPSIQVSFVNDVESWDRRQEQWRKLPMTLAVMLTAFWLVWGGSDGRSEANSVARNTPARPFMDRYPHSAELDSALVKSVNQDTDSWAIVEAYKQDRVKRSRNLRRGLGSR
jgi:hypothetical protein